MYLTDVLPLNGKELFDLMHSKRSKESKGQIKERTNRLKPFYECYLRCIRECGPVAVSPETELALNMTTIAALDMMIEEYSKRNAV